MDPSFFKELETHISNVGIDECWKRDIGKHQIWFAPVMLSAQAKINETLANEDLGAAALTEAKRVTLSHAIVGIDHIDLREYRDAGEVFTTVDPRIGKEVKVALHKYVYLKMERWGSDFIDQAFEVLADLMESHRKENLKGVKFENARDPHEELADLEMRAAELRDSLGMTQLVESSGGPSEDVGEEPAPPRKEPTKGSVEAQSSGPRPPGPQFDPFAAVVTPPEPEGTRPQPPPPAPVPTPPAPVQPQPAPVQPQPPRQVPSAGPQPPSPAVGKESSPDNPFPSSNSSDVIEKRVKRVHTSPPRIDPIKHQSINPRFKRG